jgi:hypothetical protein
MAQSTPHAIARYKILYRRRSAHFESIASPLLYVSTATHPAPYSIHSRNANKLDKGQTGCHPAHRLPLHPCHPATWLFPNMSIWPSPKHEAILWVIDHMIYFVINHRTAITYFNYTDFMHWNRWRTSMWRKRVTYYGSYLDYVGNGSPKVYYKDKHKCF